MMKDTGESPKVSQFKIRHGLEDDRMIPPMNRDPSTYAGVETRNVYDNCGMGWDITMCTNKWGQHEPPPNQVNREKELIY